MSSFSTSPMRAQKPDSPKQDIQNHPGTARRRKEVFSPQNQFFDNCRFFSLKTDRTPSRGKVAEIVNETIVAGRLQKGYSRL